MNQRNIPLIISDPSLTPLSLPRRMERTPLPAPLPVARGEGVGQSHGGGNEMRPPAECDLKIVFYAARHNIHLGSHAARNGLPCEILTTINQNQRAE